jgi:hypothetical protein
MVPLMLAAGQAPKGPTPGAQQEASAASVTKASRPETTAQEPPPAPAKQDPSAEPAPETPAEPTLQDSTAEPPPETTGEPRPVAGRQTVAKGSAMRILGRSVKGPGGTVVAQIVNVLVDDSGQPLGAVLDYGGFLGVGKRRIAVAWPMLHFEKTAITLSLTRDQLKDFPEFREGADAVLATAPAAPG